MARGKITQTRFPELVGSWPVVRAPLAGCWITLADFRSCKSPASGSLCVVLYGSENHAPAAGEPPAYSEIVTRGESVRLATYKNAAELHELGRLTKRIEDGKA